jgi:hypothetical protein
MNIPGISWTPQEAAGVNDFLNSPLGRKWLGVLLTRKPRLDLTNTERAALTGAYAAGYESFFGEMASTRVVVQEEVASKPPIDTTKD